MRLGNVIDQTAHLSKNDYRPEPVAAGEFVFVNLHGDGTVTFRVNFSHSNLENFATRLATDRKFNKFMKETELEPQLSAAFNQLLVLSSTIENKQLKPGDPTKLTSRFLLLSASDDGKVKATLDVKSNADRKLLEDAHYNRGDYTDVKGVPVGKILLPDVK